MTGIDWQGIITAVVAGGLAWLGAFIHTKKGFSKVGSLLVDIAKPVGTAVATGVKEVASLPEAKAVEAKLGLEARSLLNDFKQSTLGHLSVLAINALGSQLDNPVLFKAMSTFVEDNLPPSLKEYVKPADITDALMKAVKTIEQAATDTKVVYAKKLAAALDAHEATLVHTDAPQPAPADASQPSA